MRGTPPSLYLLILPKKVNTIMPVSEGVVEMYEKFPAPPLHTCRRVGDTVTATTITLHYHYSTHTNTKILYYATILLQSHYTTLITLHYTNYITTILTTTTTTAKATNNNCNYTTRDYATLITLHYTTLRYATLDYNYNYNCD